MTRNIAWDRHEKGWAKLTADKYAELFPARPKAIRKIARGLRLASVRESYNPARKEYENGHMRPFTMDLWELARLCDVSKRTLQRYLPVFEGYGVVEVHRWRYRYSGAMPNTYCLFFGSVIPEDWSFDYRRFAKGPK